jgi:hypothetical protein
MFADPQSVTIGSALSLPRIGSGLNSGVFQTSDGLVKYAITHVNGAKRNRHTARIDLSKVAADPLNAAQSLRYSMSCYVVLDVPPVGFTVTEQINMLTGLTGNMAASTNANWTKFIGGES